MIMMGIMIMMRIIVVFAMCKCLTHRYSLMGLRIVYFGVSITSNYNSNPARLMCQTCCTFDYSILQTKSYSRVQTSSQLCQEGNCCHRHSYTTSRSRYSDWKNNATNQNVSESAHEEVEVEPVQLFKCERQLARTTQNISNKF